MNSRFRTFLTVDRLESRRMMAADTCSVAGDSNSDGVFDSADFVEVFQFATYETGQAATLAEGDWNGDGFFNSSDFVHAFTSGRYEQPFVDCRFVESRVYDRPSEGPFSSFYLDLQPDGSGTIVPGSDIAYLITDYSVASAKDGKLTLTINTHVHTVFRFTMDSLRATTIVDEWDNEWQLSTD